MSDFFENVSMQPPNNIFGLARECSLDPAPSKVDLIIGAYRDNDGNPVVLDCVREAEKYVYESNSGYIDI